MSDGAIRKCNNFAMEKMRQKDAEDRLQRMNTKQRLGTPTRDIPLQQTVFKWLMQMLDEAPRGKSDYDKWITDGTVLVRALQMVQFNSVPIDPTTDLNGQFEKQKMQQLQKQNSSNNFNIANSSSGDRNTEDEIRLEKQRRRVVYDRIKVLIKHLENFGIPEKYIFQIEDLSELKNVPKVTRCIAMMAKMSGAKAFEQLNIDIPEDSIDEDVFRD